jgi:ubiquinone/menaquinone biosynthesis C-methylase UbiE
VEAKLQRRIQRYGWDRAARHYERFWAAQLAPAQQRLLALAAPQAGERVLDVACGTGLVTFPAAEAVGPAGFVLATDISDRMVEAGRAAAAARGLDHLRFERRDAERLDVDQGSFDVALCALGLMYVPDAARALAEMHRALKPGGRAAAAVWGARKACGWAEVFPIVDARVESEVCPLFFQLGTGDALAQVFTAAGFTDVRTDRLRTMLDYGSAEDAVGAAFVGGPVALAYSRFDEKTRAEANAEYLASIAPYRNGDGYRIPGEFVVTGGLKARTSGGAAVREC